MINSIIRTFYNIDKDKGIYSKSKKKWLKGKVKDNGYISVSLKCEDGLMHKFYYHRVIWEHFNGKIPKGYEINHKNEDKSDNRLSNLELINHKDNVNYGTCRERISKAHSKKVSQYSIDGTLINKYDSVTDAAIKNGFCKACICDCCNGKYHYNNNTYKNSIWKYD